MCVENATEAMIYLIEDFIRFMRLFIQANQFL